MKVGTKSVLFGAHCFFLHPWFVAWAWWMLNGFPWDPRLWVAFFVHDLGYIGKPNMDGPEGETHPRFGAQVMKFLFDHRFERVERKLIEIPLLEDGSFDRKAIQAAEEAGWRVGGVYSYRLRAEGRAEIYMYRTHWRWHDFVLLHSRYYARKMDRPFSKLCVADKLALVLTPRWLYLPMVKATGELEEYLRNAQKAESEHWKPTGYDPKRWHADLCVYMAKWVEEHKDGKADTWTSKDRHAVTDSGVTQ